jgi:mortality factor 4-like protein 1
MVVRYFLFVRWDEWVPENRVLKHNEANLQKQKELQAQHPE